MIALVVNSRRHARHNYLCCSVCHPLLVSRESSESKDCSINDLLPVSPPCYPVCFHTNTNCPICKPFVLITMQQYPGVGGRLAPTLLKKDFNSLPIRSATALTYLGTPHPPEARAGILLSSVGCQLWAVNPSARSSAFQQLRPAYIIPFVFTILRTLLRHGRNATLLESIPCALSLLPRGCVPSRHSDVLQRGRNSSSRRRERRRLWWRRTPCSS